MPRQGLDTRRVVETAAAIADAEGLPAVSLTRVAAVLEVRAPSLYNHVEGRAGLLRQISILSIGELTDVIRDAVLGRSGADALVSAADAYRAYALEHPGRYASTVGAAASDDAELAAVGRRAIDVLAAVLGAWGFEGDEMLRRVRVIRSALHGFVSIEATGGFGLPLDLDDSFALLLRTLVAGLDAG